MNILYQPKIVKHQLPPVETLEDIALRIETINYSSIFSTDIFIGELNNFSPERYLSGNPDNLFLTSSLPKWLTGNLPSYSLNEWHSINDSYTDFNYSQEANKMINGISLPSASLVELKIVATHPLYGGIIKLQPVNKFGVFRSWISEPRFVYATQILAAKRMFATGSWEVHAGLNSADFIYYRRKQQLLAGFKCLPSTSLPPDSSSLIAAA